MADCGRCCAIFYSEVISFRAVMKPQKTPHARLEVMKVQSAHMPFAIMDKKQCSDRALQAIYIQDLRRYGSGHRHCPQGWCGCLLCLSERPWSKDAGPHTLSTAAKP